MKLILSKLNNAYFNIAAEEYLFKSFTDDIFYLYINAPSIIIGRKQNTLAEINYDYVTKHYIPVVRRLSGGGAVFHDLGNLNFCFIMRDVDNSVDDFEHYTKPIIDVLQSLGVEAKLEGRNDLTIDGKKFSGNAKYHSNKTLLQHGTLLFKSELADLTAALNADPSKFADKAVKSIQSRVTNISEHLSHPLTLSEFTYKLLDHIMKTYSRYVYYDWSREDMIAINELIETKYGTHQWNFGKSPKYDFAKSIRTPGGSIQVAMVVKDGSIQKLNFYGDFFSHKDIDKFETLFENVPHNRDDITDILSKHPADEYFINITNDDILSVMF